MSSSLLCVQMWRRVSIFATLTLQVIIQTFVHTIPCARATHSVYLLQKSTGVGWAPGTQITYFGFFRGVLHMPPDDMYGGLPYRDARGTVTFDNKPELVCGFLPELCHGGVLGHVFEVLHFPGSERCTGPFRGYVAYNYRDKMEASGWASMTGKSPPHSPQRRRRRFVTVSKKRTEGCVVRDRVTWRTTPEGGQ
jgi:hypothetical protein